MVCFVDEEEVEPLGQRHRTEGGMNTDARRLLGQKVVSEREHLLPRGPKFAHDFFCALGRQRRPLGILLRAVAGQVRPLFRKDSADAGHGRMVVRHQMRKVLMRRPFAGLRTRLQRRGRGVAQYKLH
jgi:hypothetical protein